MFKQNRSLSLPTFAAVAGLTVSSQALAGDQAGAKVGGKIYTSYGYDLKPTPYKGYKDGDPRPNGFNIDRVYLDYRKRIDETFSIRATTDVGWADSGKLELYAVNTQAMASQMATRGYSRVYVNHLGDDTHLPPAIREQPQAGRRRRRPCARRSRARARASPARSGSA